MKNKKKALLLSLVAALGIASCSHKSKNNNEDTYEEHEIVSVMPIEEYHNVNYDAKALQTVPIYDKEIKEVIGWIWQNDYCNVISTNGNYDYIRNIENVYGYVEHQNLIKIPSTYCNYYAYITNDTETYTGPSSKLYELTGNIIEANQKVLVVEEFENYSYCIDEFENYTYIPNCNLKKLSGSYLETDISEKKSFLYVHNELMLEFLITPGADNTPTPEGCYQVTGKARGKTLKDGAYVEYWVSFIADLFGYHDAKWRNASDFGSDIYHTNGSHGCINCKEEDIIIVYENVEVGTKVLIHK